MFQSDTIRARAAGGVTQFWPVLDMGGYSQPGASATGYLPTPTSQSPGGAAGIGPAPSGGVVGLVILGVIVLGLVGFNISTRAFQA